MGDLGFAEQLGNYAEYSGAPNTAETYAYAKTLLDCATANADGARPWMGPNFRVWIYP